MGEGSVDSVDAQAPPPIMTTTGGDVAVAALVAHGVDTVFGIPGGHNLALYDALAREPAIRHVLPRHEQGAAFMADGYARTSGRTGVMVTLGGPGLTNAMTGLGEAYSDSSPLLSISSQIPSDLIPAERGMIHELRDQNTVLAAVCRWSRRATSHEEIAALVAQAVADHAHGRPAPIHIEIPLDLLGAEASGPAAVVAARATAEPDHDAIEAAVARIDRGGRPVIYAGGGVNRAGASAELTALADALGAPVITTALGKGAIAEDHPLYVATTSLWSPWMREGAVAGLIAAADPLIVVGGRLSDASTCDWRMPEPVGIVQIDVDATRLGETYRHEVGVVGDARRALALLAAAVTARVGSAGAGEIAAAREAVMAHARAGLGWGASLLDDIGAVLGPETVLTGDSLIGLWAAVAWRTNRPRSYHVPLHFNTLGFALPAAVGAKVARPDVPVVAIAGDGAFMFTVAELSAAVQERVPVIVVVCNDGGYESIRRQQADRFGGRTYAVDVRAPDFPALAEAMGAAGYRAGPDDFADVLAKAAEAGRPALVEVPLSVAGPWA
jgi:thiamine pyrophosphate-dependent acetolactate synthase large subunit-like protein